MLGHICLFRSSTRHKSHTEYFQKTIFKLIWMLTQYSIDDPTRLPKNITFILKIPQNLEILKVSTTVYSHKLCPHNNHKKKKTKPTKISSCSILISHTVSGLHVSMCKVFLYFIYIPIPTQYVNIPPY